MSLNPPCWQTAGWMPLLSSTVNTQVAPSRVSLRSTRATTLDNTPAPVAWVERSETRATPPSDFREARP